ncbi:MAG: glycosyltransferase family 39 protein [Dehalococcoidia bacterium]
MQRSVPPPLPTRFPPPLPPREAPVVAPRHQQPVEIKDETWIWWSLAAIIGTFMVFGLIWVAFADNIPWADADFYFRGAKSMAEGKGYVHPFQDGHPPTAFFPVGYPWMLGHVWKVLGIDTASCNVGTWPTLTGCGDMIQVGQILNVFLAALNIALVFILAALLRGSRTALLAALLYALIPSRFLFTASLMSEESFVTLVLLALIMVVLGVKRQEWVWLTAVGFGLAVGACAFIRPLGIVLLPLPLILLFSNAISPRIALTQVLVGSVIAALVLLPWTIRNHNEVGGWNLVSNNGGINLWIGCHLNENGKLASNGQWRDWWSGDAPASINTADERANDAKAQSLGLECIRKQPLAFARLGLVKGLYTFAEDWTYVSKWSLNYRLPEEDTHKIVSAEVIDSLTYLTNGVYLLLLPLAAVGAIATLYAPSVYRGLLGVAFAALAFVPLMFFGEPRFHVPLLPFMSIWAADGVIIVTRGLRSAAHETVEGGDVRERGMALPYRMREDV